MQELIPKSEVIKMLFEESHLQGQQWHWDLAVILDLVTQEIEALPTPVHHEYTVGDAVEFSEDWENWTTWVFGWFKSKYYNKTFPFANPAQEHPDITQARELASRHWYSVISLSKI